MTDIITEMGTAFTSAQGDIMAMIKLAVPAAMIVVAAILAVKVGIKFFKSVAKG